MGDGTSNGGRVASRGTHLMGGTSGQFLVCLLKEGPFHPV